MKKAIGYTLLRFKKNDGKWHDLTRTMTRYQLPHETIEKSYSYSEIINTDNKYMNRFMKTKDRSFPFGKECLRWNWFDEDEYIYPEDSITLQKVWMPDEDITFDRLMKNMNADDFLEYCKDKGVVVSVGGTS